MIEIHLENYRRSREALVMIQSEAAIFADRLLSMAQQLKSLARESAEGLCKLHELNQVINPEVLKALGELPTREKLDSILTGIITHAATAESARTELNRLGISATTGAQK